MEQLPEARNARANGRVDFGPIADELFPGETWLAVVVALAVAAVLIGIIVLRERRRIVRERNMMDEETTGA